MAGCDYKYPTKQNVHDDMQKALRTLDNYLETTGAAENTPDIWWKLVDYVNGLKQELRELEP